ncbi:hypothetical protein Xmar_07065 [Xanthomonas axonopodis pv. martyniicola]|nr:hypothetical protein Xmar_07065 [Xanthomonas axonopodis pv. martyniicola]OOW93215.1 hypothetical protein Xvtr_15110 [Xanthomonas campestris pv. vitiscarnosae]
MDAYVQALDGKDRWLGAMAGSCRARCRPECRWALAHLVRIDANDFIHRSVIANGTRAADLGIGMAR